MTIPYRVKIPVVQNGSSDPVEAAEGRTAHNKWWIGVNGMASNTWKPCGMNLKTIPLQPLPVLSYYPGLYPHNTSFYF